MKPATVPILMCEKYNKLKHFRENFSIFKLSIGNIWLRIRITRALRSVESLLPLLPLFLYFTDTLYDKVQCEHFVKPVATIAVHIMV